MRSGDKRVFNDPIKRYHLINFRLFGYSETTLAVMFNCHWTSIDSVFKKYQIPKPKEIYTLERIIAQVLPQPETPQWKTVAGVKYNLGRDYKDYLK